MLFVDHGLALIGDIDNRSTKGGGRAKTIRGCGASELAPERRRNGSSIPLVLAIESKKNIRGGKEAGDAGDRLRISDSFLEGTIQCTQEINTCGRSVGSDLPADPRSVDESGRQRVLRFTPSIGTEIGTWEFEHAEVSILGIKPCCCVGPIRRKG